MGRPDPHARKTSNGMWIGQRSELGKRPLSEAEGRINIS